MQALVSREAKQLPVRSAIFLTGRFGLWKRKSNGWKWPDNGKTMFVNEIKERT